MRKCALCCVALICCMMSAKGQESLRDRVAVVRPTIQRGSSKFVQDYSRWLRREGFTNAANVLEGYGRGGFGTRGFSTRIRKPGGR